MKIYNVPVVWSLGGDMRIEANSLEEAVQKAYQEPLPEGFYLDDSFIVIKDDISLDLFELLPEENCDPEQKKGD
jgi:hypothetical protein